MAEAENSNYSIIKMIGEKDITSYTKQGLERKKNYYFKIRAYTEVGGKKTFGDYSSVVGIEVK